MALVLKDAEKKVMGTNMHVLLYKLVKQVGRVFKCKPAGLLRGAVIWSRFGERVKFSKPQPDHGSPEQACGIVVYICVFIYIWLAGSHFNLDATTDP